MIRILLAAPAIFFSLVWSVFFPTRHPAVPAPAPPREDPSAPSTESHAAGHEVSDASARTVGLFVLGLFAVIFIAMAALGVMYRRMYADTAAVPGPPVLQSFENAPRDKTSIAQDWDQIEQVTHQRLDHYGWVDQAHGVIRVPIARAMILVAQEGLPARVGQTPEFPPPAEEKLPLMELESTADATKPDPH